MTDVFEFGDVVDLWLQHQLPPSYQSESNSDIVQWIFAGSSQGQLLHLQSEP